MAEDRNLTLHFNDGSRMVFDFPEQGPNAAAKQIKLAEFLTSQHLVVEADGEVLIFPIANIKYIALSGMVGRPAAHSPSPYPKHAIVGARVRK